MIKPIVLYGKRLLRQPSIDFKEGEDLSQLIEDMYETMESANGAGLAAPQIGINKRLFIIDVPYSDLKATLINAKITKHFGMHNTLTEGCLSIPGLSGEVIRQAEIEIEYFDENWKFHKESFRGMNSRVIQHEHDHLEGILWIDKVEPSEGMKLAKDLIAIQDRTMIDPGFPYI